MGGDDDGDDDDNGDDDDGDGDGDGDADGDGDGDEGCMRCCPACQAEKSPSSSDSLASWRF